MAAILEIENIEIDLSDNPISLNKQAYRVADWSTNVLTFSDRVTIPETEKIRQLLKRPDRPEIVENKFGRYYDFKYKDHNTVLFAGKAILLKSNSEVEIQLIDGAKEFFDNLNKNLNQLDFESDDFVFSVAEYDLKKIENDSIWIWPAVCMHTNRNVNNTILAGGTANAKLKFSRPCFKFGKIAEKMFSVNKWSFINAPIYDFIYSVCFSSNAKQFYVTSYQKTLNGDFVGNQQIGGLNVNDFIYNVTVGGINNNLNIGNTTTIFRLRGYITADVDSIFLINGVSSPLGTDTQQQEFLIKSGTNYYDIVSNEFKTSENSNIITFLTESTGTINFDNVLLYTIIEEQELGALSGNNLINYLVKVYDNLPDITQKDMLFNMVSFLGALPITSTFKRTLNMNSYIYLNKLNSIDWSDKFIFESAEFEGKIGNYGRNNYFSFDNDDTVSESLGRGEFNVNNETLQDVKTIFKNKFGASNDVEIDSLEMADFNIYDDSGRINEINDRILFFQLDSGLGISYATFKPLEGDKILNQFHKKITDSVFDTLIIEAEFSLNRNDFFSFDFTKPVFISQLKSYFLVLNIESFVNGRTTKVKLLKFK